ncbi:hypothetical protein BaRGS_00025730 [Batillaria attramentaria]|uniref:GPI ethanolamine phosphate transferase 1 n=1 Tax=Batillaria attramentaria TaxID=370345 RepID=A0ABD0K6M1_9CAEN
MNDEAFKTHGSLFTTGGRHFQLYSEICPNNRIGDATQPGEGGQCEEWAMVELQGELETRHPVPLSGKQIGDLHFTNKDVPVLIIGHHILYGKVVQLEKPFAVLTKRASHMEQPMEHDGTGNQESRKAGEKMKLWQLIFAGVLVHVILFYSIFDIYFTSPLVHGMTPHVSSVPPPAKRLVLFVADGLRADKLFGLDSTGTSRAPYIHSIIQSVGSWGVSHTRVPTESRPGHVALIAGFYEDVSAVAKGWKENPVEFDSVFNESRFTWSWGSEDILPMFAKGATGSHVMMKCYPQHLEDFAHSDMTQLDRWVFNEVKKFFASAEKNETLRDMLQKDKLVFFLHLLGIDTTGHSRKPHSDEYSYNIRVVDEGVQKLVQLLEDYYKDDGKTAYVVTADHGMTNWGSHGAGHPSETLTPLVAWGAGVHKARPVEKCGHYSDSFCEDWKLQNRARFDVDQADVAPLMSFLIGVPFPVNSVGFLRTDYLSGSDHEKAEGLFANAQQIMAQFQVKMAQVRERTISATFRPFPGLLPSKQVTYIRDVRNLIDKGFYKDAMEECTFLIRTALEGLRYYQTYDRVFLGFSITLGFLGWMGHILTLLISQHASLPPPGQQGRPFMRNGGYSYIHLVSALATFIILFLLYIQSLPWTNYFYCLLPVLLWMKFAEGWGDIYVALQCAVRRSALLHVLVSIVLCILGLEVIVQSFFHRELLCLGLVAMGVWSFTTPVMTTDKLLVIAVATVIVKVTSDSIANRQGSPFFTRVLSWSILVVSPCLPLFTGPGLQERLVSIGMAFVAPFILMSITYEGLFLLSLICLLYFWLRIEFSLSQHHSQRVFSEISFRETDNVQRGGGDKVGSVDGSRHLEIADLRRAFFFVFLIAHGFFGTGNIASINSFDPASVYCFITVFNPFVMAALMMYKVVLPFVVVTCALRAVQVVTCVPLRALILLILLMSDFMGLHFFFLVRDYGSWLEIGTSISHYVIVMGMITFVMVLLGVSRVLTNTTVCQRTGTSTAKSRD